MVTYCESEFGCEDSDFLHDVKVAFADTLLETGSASRFTQYSYCGGPIEINS